MLGVLRRDVKNRLVLEDASGAVPVAGLAQADASGVLGFLAEGACMLMSGEMQAGGAFRARSVAEPPVEDRAAAVASLRGLNISGARPLRCVPWELPTCPAWHAAMPRAQLTEAREDCACML